MHLLFTDETNMPSDPKATFFAYGGLIVPPNALVELDRGITQIRAGAGYRALDELKFETNARPQHVTVETCAKTKQAVVDLCIKLDCKFIVYVVLHAIAKNTSQSDLIGWGANHVIGKFNYFLSTIGAHGIVAVDRLPAASEYSFLTDKFCLGLDFQDESHVVLDRIKLFASTCINASHASSAMDIVLGSFRYCINQPKNVPAAKQMMANISRLIWCEREGDNLYTFERGLIFRPKDVKVEVYKQAYKDLLDSINALLADEGQGAV